MRPACCSSRQRPAHCMYAVALTALFVICGQVPSFARTEAAQLTPRVDTLWTRNVANMEYTGFTACALGGTPQVLLVCSKKFVTSPPQLPWLAVFDPLTGDTIRSVLSGHTSDVTDMHFAARANIFGTADYGTIKLWRWPQLEVVREFRTPSDHQNRFLLTADGRRLYSNIDGVMYDTETGDTLWQVERAQVESFGTDVRPAMTADDSLLVTVRTVKGRGQLALVVNVRTGEVLDQLPGGDGASWIAAVDISEDGRYVAVSRTPTNEQGFLQPGNCVIYDRIGKQITRIYKLIGSFSDGKELGFAKGSPGFALFRSGPDLNSGYYYFRIGDSLPSAWWAGYFSPRFSFDGQFHYGRSGGGGTIWLGQFDLNVASVANTDDDRDVVPYPNPVDGTLTLTGLAYSDGAARAEVIDVTGRRLLVTSVDVSVGTCRLDVSSVPAGTHQLRLQRASTVVYSTSFTKR